MLLWILFVVLVAAGLLWALNPKTVDALFGQEDPPHASDEELIANFRLHRAEFEHLRDMLVADKGLLRVADQRTLPEDPQSVGVPQSRIAEYRRLLKALGIRGGIAISEDRKTIEFNASFRGYVTHNSEKGYIYTTEPAQKSLVPDLDVFLKSEVGAGRRRIEDSWYLFFEGY